MKIAHLSDIHILGYSRHKEFKNGFDRLFQKLKAVNLDYICVLGDLWHTKTEGLTPEGIELIVYFLKGLSDIASTHVILGNHDGNLGNLSKQDVISPIIEAMDNKNIHLYKMSGNYEFSPNKYFNVCSLFDKENWDKGKPVPGADLNISLFHGSMVGCATDAEWIMKNAEVELDLFEGHDFVFMGDIHKAQHMAHRPHKGITRDLKPYISYCGSLFQNNHGESEEKGFLVWDIEDKNNWNVYFEVLENLQPYLTFPWLGNVATTLENIKNTRPELLKGTRYRLEHKETIIPVELSKIEKELKKLGAAEVVRKDVSQTNIKDININTDLVKNKSLRNDKETLLKLFDDYLSFNKEKHVLNEAQYKKTKEEILFYLSEVIKKDGEDTLTRDIIWSPKSIEFNNTFGYGEGNKLDFESLRGIVGILGDNQAGKSSLIGTLIFSLFNSTVRKAVKNYDIINDNKDECFAKTVFSVNDADYVIERKSVKQKGKNNDKTVSTTSVSLKKITDKQNENKNSITRVDTDKQVKKLIGTAEDFLMTSYSNEDSISKFIFDGGTERKNTLFKFLELDLFQELFLLAKEDLALYNKKSLSFTTTDFEKLSKDLEEHLTVSSKKIEDCLKVLEFKRKNLSQLKNEILGKESFIELNKKYNFELNELQKIDKEKSKYEKQKEVVLNNIKEKQQQKELNLLFLKNNDIEYLNDKKEKLNTIRQKLQELKSSKINQERILQEKEKSVKKLSLVPCGDSFPTCHYIKDSHEDKKTIETQKQMVAELSETLLATISEAEKVEKEKIEETVKKYDEIKRNLSSLEQHIKSEEDNFITISELLIKIGLEEELTNRKKEELELKLKKTDTSTELNVRNKIKIEESDIENLEKDKNKCLVDVGIAQEKLKNIKQEEIEYTELLSKIKIYESIVGAFSKNGIPAIILKNQLPIINLELEKIMGGFVNFKVSIEMNDSTNAMDIYLEGNGTKRVIELASGAEGMISALALRVALIKLSSLPKTDILIIDEGFGKCDAKNRQNLLNLLKSLKTQFKTIFVISHISDVKEVADKILEVKTDGLFSKIQVC